MWFVAGTWSLPGFHDKRYAGVRVGSRAGGVQHHVGGVEAGRHLGARHVHGSAPAPGPRRIWRPLRRCGTLSGMAAA